MASTPTRAVGNGTEDQIQILIDITEALLTGHIRIMQMVLCVIVSLFVYSLPSIILDIRECGTGTRRKGAGKDELELGNR